MKKSHYPMLLIGFLLIAGGLAGFLYVRSRTETTKVLGSTSNAPTYKFTDNTYGVYADIPAQFKKQDLKAQDSTNLLVLLEANSAGDKYGPVSLTVSVELGLRLPANLQKLSPLEVVVGNLDKTLKQKYPGYTKISEEKYTVSNKSAIRYDFTYDGKNSLKVTQRLIVIERDADSVAYFRLQALTNTFEMVEKDLLGQVHSSIVVR